jgi:hypothetical protein
VEHGFNNHYSTVISGYDSHKWRIDRYYYEYVDNFLKAYMPVMDAIYKSNGVKEPGKE